MNTPDSSRRLDRVSQLPQDIAPARDLWPAIASAIEALPQQPPRRFGAWGLGLAAGIALLGVGFLIGRQTPDALAPATQPMLAVSFEPGESYQKARAAQLEQLPARLAALSPESRRQVLASLETLRRSLDEIRKALGEDPANLLLQSMLVNTYQEEMRVLTTVNEAGSAGQEI
jgi:hypothetical protein